MFNFDDDRKTNAGIFAREGYEASVGLRALERAGQNPNLHGHVHELMFCDKFNVNPLNFLQGEHMQLTKSATARMKDVVVMRGNRVVGHAQLKDAADSVQNLIPKINSGKYGKTAIFGTEETAAKLAGRTTQKVHSSGISSETTKRIAGKALGKMPTVGQIGAAARSGGVYGAAIGAGIEAVSSAIDVYNGDKEFGDAVIDVGGAAIKGGIVGAGSAVAGTAVAGVVGGLTAVAAAPAVAGFAAACAVGSLISSIFD